MNQPVESGSVKAGFRTALVVGANRGIGLALSRALLQDSSVERLIAVHRAGSDTAKLQALQDSTGGRLQRRVLDFGPDEPLDEFTAFLESLPAPLDIAIHAAGLLHEGEIQPEKSIRQARADHLLKVFEVNSVYPLMVAKAVLDAQPRKHRFVFAALSAMVGSIGDNRLGGWYAYRASKAALNQFVKTLSIECRMRFPGASIVAVHPGTTDTDLSRPFQKNVSPEKLYTPGKTASRILGVLGNLDADRSGEFLNWDGDTIPW